MKSRPLFFDLYNQVFVNLLYINQTWWWWRWWLENELKLYLVNAITGKDIVLWDMQLNPFNVCVCVRPVEDFPNSLLYNMWSFGVPCCSFSIRLAPSYILTTTGVLLLCSPIFSLEKKAYSENKKERKKKGRMLFGISSAHTNPSTRLHPIPESNSSILGCCWLGVLCRNLSGSMPSSCHQQLWTFQTLKNLFFFKKKTREFRMSSWKLKKRDTSSIVVVERSSCYCINPKCVCCQPTRSESITLITHSVTTTSLLSRHISTIQAHQVPHLVQLPLKPFIRSLFSCISYLLLFIHWSTAADFDKKKP